MPPMAADLPPRIAITAYREDTRWGAWSERADLLTATYADAVAAAGAVPILLSVAGAALEGSARAPSTGCTAWCCPGAPTSTPPAYGRERGPHTDAPRVERDAWETALALEALERGLPLLGICRGMQLLNVALGGTLIQHLPDAVGHDQHRLVVGEFALHDIHTAAGTVIDDIVGRDSGPTASHHHQAVDAVAPVLTATAWAEDGTVEAVEMPGCRGWMLAVQWHPEEVRGTHVFASLVEAAVAYRGRVEASPVAG